MDRLIDLSRIAPNLTMRETLQAHCGSTNLLWSWLKTNPGVTALVQMLLLERERPTPRTAHIAPLTARLANYIKRDLVAQIFGGGDFSSGLTEGVKGLNKKHPARRCACPECKGTGRASDGTVAAGRRQRLKFCTHCNRHGYVCNGCGGSFGERYDETMRLCPNCA